MLSIDKFADGRPLVISEYNKIKITKFIEIATSVSPNDLLRNNEMIYTEENFKPMYDVDKSILHDSGLDDKDNFECQFIDTGIIKRSKDIDTMIDALRRDCATMRQTRGRISAERISEECIKTYKDKIGYMDSKMKAAKYKSTAINGKIKIEQKDMLDYVVYASPNYMVSELLTENFKSLIRAVVEKVQEVEIAEKEVKARGIANVSRTDKTLYNIAQDVTRRAAVDGIENILGQLFNTF